MQGNPGASGQEGQGKDLDYGIMTIDRLDKGEVSDDSMFLQSFNASYSFVTASQIKRYMDSPDNASFQNEVFERKEEGSRLKALLATETSARQSEDAKLQSRIELLATRQTATEETINTLKGTGEGSIKKSIADKIAEVVSDALEAFDTLKEIADWVGKHEHDALSIQTSISENASGIKKETEERKDADDELKAGIRQLIQGLEQEAVERKNAGTYIYNSLKEDFENRIAGIAENKIGEVVDRRLSEISSNVVVNAENIDALEGEVSDIKGKIDTLEKTEWQILSGRIKSVNVNSILDMGQERLPLNIPDEAKIVSFVDG